MTNNDKTEGSTAATIAALATAQAQDIPNGAVLVPPGYFLADVERFTSVRRNLRGTYHATTIGDFVRYYAAHVDAAHLDGSPIFINPDNGTAFCVFDMTDADGDPGHQEHVAHLALAATPEWATLLRMAYANPHEQEDVIEFLIDWGDSVQAVAEDGTTIEPAALVKAFREVKLTRTSEATQHLTDTTVARSALEQVEARSKTVTPASMTFTAAPFVDFQTRPLVVRVLARPGKSSPNAVAFVLRVQRLEQVQHDVALEFKDLLIDAILGQYPDHAPAIFIGTWADAPRDRLHKAF